METNYMAFAGLNRKIRPTEKIDRIIKTVCDHFEIEKSVLEGKAKYRRISDPRQIAMVLLSRNTRLPLAEIGRLFGDRDHTTVVHAKKSVANLCEFNEKYKETFDLLERKIQ